MFEATRVTLICEVDLGPRRPDCICVFEFANDKTLGGVCVIIELKTCKYISSGDTASKREQRATGMKQDLDPLRHQILGGRKAIQFTLQGFPTLPEGAPAGNSGSLAVHKTAQSSYRHVSPLQATCFLFALAFSLVQIAQ